MASNMIERLGREWCNQRMVGGNFVHDGKLMQVMRVGNAGVTCQVLKTGKIVELSQDVFTGFKVFRYPPLGYRKYGPGLALWLSKVHSYQRGLRDRCINVQFSPVSTLLYNSYNHKMDRKFDPPGTMELVFFPQYDTVDDLPKLYEGDTPCIVLNENVLIEANIANENAEGYTVYFKRNPCATIDYKHRLHWFSAAYQEALAPIFNRG